MEFWGPNAEIGLNSFFIGFCQSYKNRFFSIKPIISVFHHSNAPMACIYGTANLLRPGIEDQVFNIGIDALRKAIAPPGLRPNGFF